MEENNSIDSQTTAVEDEIQPVQEAQSQSEPSSAALDSAKNETKVQVRKPVRKNGRNNAAKKTSQISAANSATCGEIEDLSSFKEKLSGSNVEGYGEDESSENRKNQRERGEKRQRKPRCEEKPEEVSEADSPKSQEEVKDEKPVRSGPSFETDKQFAPRAIEVGLTDHRSPFSNESKAKEGVVSYSPDDCKCPSISLWMRIKEAVASIFGKKPNKKRKNKIGGDKNWKGRGDRKFSNKNGDWKKGGHRKNGGNKRRYNDRRPGGSKPSKGGGEKSAS